MEILLLILMSVFGMLTLIALCGVVVPIKSLGLNTRKEAGQAAAASLFIALVAAGIYAVISLPAKNNEVVGTKTGVSEPVVSEEVSPPDSQEPNEPEADDAWKAVAVEAIVNEPLVVEAMFPNGSNRSFWASVRDDGSRRDGYAEYLCLTLYEHGMPRGQFVVIRIWDAYAMANGEFKEIGKYNCQLR